MIQVLSAGCDALLNEGRVKKLRKIAIGTLPEYGVEDYGATVGINRR
jgi:hypothetical protein